MAKSFSQKPLHDLELKGGVKFSERANLIEVSWPIVDFWKAITNVFLVGKVIFSQRLLAKTRQIQPMWKSSDVCVSAEGA